MFNLEMLNLSKYDPTKDIVIIKVYVGNLPPEVQARTIRAVEKQVGPLLLERGFRSIIFGVTKEMLELGFTPNISVEQSDDLIDENTIATKSHTDPLDIAKEALYNTHDA